MDIPVEKDKKFVSVEFPGIVDNVDKALQCLGGEATIEKVFIKYIGRNKANSMNLLGDNMYFNY